jgi:hypothetical protein
MNKLQKILLAAAPIIAQPPPLHPVLQVASGGCCGVLGKGFSYTKGELADKGVEKGSIFNSQPRHSTDYIRSNIVMTVIWSPVKTNVS